MPFRSAVGGFKPFHDHRGTVLDMFRCVIFMAVLYSMGVVSGIVAYFTLPIWLRLVLSNHMAQALTAAGRASYHAGFQPAFLDSIFGVLIVLFLWILGQIPYSSPGIAGILFLRASSLGLAFILAIDTDGLKGAEFDLLGVLPWNILFAGGIILAACAGQLMTRHVRRVSLSAVRYRTFILYCCVFFVAIGMVFLAGWIESVTVPYALHAFAMDR